MLKLSILICVATFFILVQVLRRKPMSLGLPIAYLFSLLLIHVPGAYAHAISDRPLYGSEYTEIGIQLTAIGTVSFLLGVSFGRFKAARTHVTFIENQQFWIFCLLGGWLATYALSWFGRIPSIGATIDKGGAVWMLGVLLALRYALQRSDLTRVGVWLIALSIYPAAVLLFGGFLSYGSTAVIISISVLAITTRSYFKMLVGLLVLVFISLSLFPNYFANRDNIRETVWTGAPLQDRVESVVSIFNDFEPLTSGDKQQIDAFDQRLNQNYFAGLAARRIETGNVDFLYGRSVWEGILSLVPRIFWPEKPVFGGSPKIVSEMTGLQLSPTTSFGVGNVMEFYINFGYMGLTIGFFFLGWLINWLDYQAARAELNGKYENCFIYFLPGVALVQPNGSLVELVSGAAAALVAGYVWRWVCIRWVRLNVRKVHSARDNKPGHYVGR